MRVYIPMVCYILMVCKNCREIHHEEKLAFNCCVRVGAAERDATGRRKDGMAEPTPATTRRQENALKTREALIAAGITRMVHSGYEATSLAQVAADARVSKGAIYHHFPDKRSFFSAVYEAAKKRSLEGIQHAIAEAKANEQPDPIGAALDAAMAAVRQDAEYPALRLQANAVLSFEERKELEKGQSLPLVGAMLTRLSGDGDAGSAAGGGAAASANLDAVATLFIAMFDAVREEVAKSSDPDATYAKFRPALLAAMKALLHSVS